MNEDEIMLALKRCSQKEIETCRLCPLFSVDWCNIELSKNVLMLIETKNMKIERLRGDKNES